MNPSTNAPITARPIKQRRSSNDCNRFSNAESCALISRLNQEPLKILLDDDSLKIHQSATDAFQIPVTMIQVMMQPV